MRQSPGNAAVILAAGRGTRLASIADPYTKTFLDVAGLPIIGYAARVVELFVDHIVIVGHPSTGNRAAQTVRDSLSDPGVTVDLVFQKEPLGMADAMRCGFDALHVDRPVVVVAGDNIVLDPANVRRAFDLLDPHRDPPIELAWSYVEHEPAVARRFSVYRPLSKTTGELIEKPAHPPSRRCWCGPVAFASAHDARRRIGTLTPSGRGEYEAPDLMNGYLRAGRGRSFPLKGPFFDVGTPEALAKAEKVISQETR